MGGLHNAIGVINSLTEEIPETVDHMDGIQQGLKKPSQQKWPIS